MTRLLRCLFWCALLVADLAGSEIDRRVKRWSV